MFKPPAHKSGTAGQIKNCTWSECTCSVYRLCNHTAQKPSNQPSVQFPKYLHEEIARMEKAEKPKLSFDEWWHENNDDTLYYEWARKVWKAAQENV